MCRWKAFKLSCCCTSHSRSSGSRINFRFDGTNFSTSVLPSSCSCSACCTFMICSCLLTSDAFFRWPSSRWRVRLPVSSPSSRPAPVAASEARTRCPSRRGAPPAPGPPTSSSSSSTLSRLVKLSSKNAAEDGPLAPPPVLPAARHPIGTGSSFRNASAFHRLLSFNTASKAGSTSELDEFVAAFKSLLPFEVEPSIGVELLEDAFVEASVVRLSSPGEHALFSTATVICSRFGISSS
mmetsp:Transcript_13389/g.32807  ORF Transcript_13389/g.32807 Transcript_13389/m.32807 type:complete len:238 (-) Transcript_13389:2463-3176(-)